MWCCWRAHSAPARPSLRAALCEVRVAPCRAASEPRHHFAPCFAAAGVCRDETLEVTSPTFLLDNTYERRSTETAAAGVAVPVLICHHLDLYRLSEEDADAGVGGPMDRLGLRDAFARDVSIVEWPSRLGAATPEQHLLVRLSLAPAVRPPTQEAAAALFSRLSGTAINGAVPAGPATAVDAHSGAEPGAGEDVDDDDVRTVVLYPRGPRYEAWVRDVADDIRRHLAALQSSSQGAQTASAGVGATLHHGALGLAPDRQ